jgi:LSD1 subclass zinc finger protein
MQPFICPDCGHQSTFDPLVSSALCPRCGFAPPTGALRSAYVRDISRRQLRLFLTELLSHWDETHEPDSTGTLPTPEEAQGFFWAYCRALGEMAQKQPGQEVIQAFATAYAHLRRGEREEAAQLLQELTSSEHAFADAWVWLTATTEDPVARRRHLETALLIEPAHPLARKALESVPTFTLAPDSEDSLEIRVMQCPHCSCAVSYDPGATEVECWYCQASLVVLQNDSSAS